MSGTLSGEVESVRRRAADLAAGLSKTARRSATIAQERAVLRMLGVDGLDRGGRPLAASLAERYCGSDPARLAHGVILPFAVAMLEYDLPARELALEGARGAVDLGLEAELLDRPDRLAGAERLASQLLDSAFARFDANRTATREMREVLGVSDEPWLAVALRASEVEAAAGEIRAVVGEGADVVQIRVPASWEFAEARRQAGLDTPDAFEVKGRTGREPRPGGRRWRTRPARSARPARSGSDPVPAGSQRGLASLRMAADEAAAERGCYASLMTVTSAFAAPEQAVVAAFERIDLVEADPIREIVEDNVDPERALADHAFAHQLQARAGCRVVMGPGPLALGADVASGLPSDAATQAGRGLALQALGVELALADGLPAERLLIGALPRWVADEGDACAILVQAWLRHLVFSGHRLVVAESDAEPQPDAAMAALMTAMSGAAASLVVRHVGPGRVSAASRDLRTAASAAAAVRASLGDGALRGDAADLAARTLRAAGATLERLAAEGWSSLLGPNGGGSETERLGRAAVVERADGPTSGARILRGAF
ncbi:MAG: lysine 5,6-aminomutase subunit alpha [Candidatus Limnocylindrales bacterium]